MDIFDHSTSTGCFSNKEYTDDTLGELRVHVNLKHRVNDARDFLSSYSNRRDQSGLKGCFTAMWKGNGKTTTLSLLLDSVFPKKNTIYARNSSPGDKRENEMCTCEIKSMIAMAKAAFNKKKYLFTSKLN